MHEARRYSVLPGSALKLLCVPLAALLGLARSNQSSASESGHIGRVAILMARHERIHRRSLVVITHDRCNRIEQHAFAVAATPQIKTIACSSVFAVRQQPNHC